MRDGDELDAALGETADIEFQLKMITEKAAEGMDHNNIEAARLGRRRFHEPLEFRAAVIRSGGAGFDEAFRDPPSLGQAIGFCLAFLIGDGEVILRLPARRYAEIECRTRSRLEQG